MTASYEVGARTVKKFARSPQLIIAGTAQGALFLLIFRYVFGGVGALATGSLSYVDFLVPGFVVTSVLFSGMGAATGIAEDLEGGLFDRLRSLPIRLLSIISGRIGADTAVLTWGLVITTLFGVLVGFRVQNGAGAARGGLRAVCPLRFRLLLALHRARSGGRQPAGGAGNLIPGLPALVRLECVRAHRRPCPAGCRASPAISP